MDQLPTVCDVKRQTELKFRPPDCQYPETLNKGKDLTLNEWVPAEVPDSPMSPSPYSKGAQDGR